MPVSRILFTPPMYHARRNKSAGALQSDCVLKQRLEAVEERIHSACQRSGRHRSEVTLVAVTKVFPATVVREAYDIGLRDFGENYVQEFAEKLPQLGPMPEARFHLIGHLQSNKAKPAAEIFQIIQTVDTPKLARRLDAAGKPLDVMIEVKLSHEEAKAGADIEAIPELIGAIRRCPNLHLAGLMTMPPWSDDPELSRPYFRRLRVLGEALDVSALSMGMSHDFEAAIEEGATHIRVGTALFGKRRKP
jgi:pyridoxal phosphate enzyme (YggS family)